MRTQNLPENTILLRYGAQTTSKGFLPYYTRNGKYHCVPCTPPILEDRQDALSIALEEAQDEASHYAGDWTIIIEEIPQMISVT